MLRKGVLADRDDTWRSAFHRLLTAAYINLAWVGLGEK